MNNKLIAAALVLGLFALVQPASADTGAGSSDDTCSISDGVLGFTFCTAQETITAVEEALCGSGGCTDF